jgi:hypothetical protein
MITSMFFAFWRFLEIITLIPTLGMLAYFVHGFVDANELTPNYVLVLFITSVLAAVWAIATLFHRARPNALFIAFIDICFVGAFIAGVYELRFISSANCSSANASAGWDISLGIFGSADINGVNVDVNKNCEMLKTSFAFGIMNCIFFSFTSLLALSLGRGSERKDTYVRETHYSRHGQRRSGSHRSHRSSHSGRRHAYV